MSHPKPHISDGNPIHFKSDFQPVSGKPVSWFSLGFPAASTLASLALAIILSLLWILSSTAQVRPAFIRQVQVMEAEKTGLVNPAGLVFSTRTNAIYGVELPEVGQPLPLETNFVQLTPFGRAVGSNHIPVGLQDPLNMVMDGKFRRLLFLQKSTGQLIAMPEAGDGSLGPGLTRYDTGGLNLQDPQGIAIDPASGNLFILDAAGPRLLILSPGLDGDFSVAAVSEIGLQSTPLIAPRGLAFDPTTAHLHTLSPTEARLYELTLQGQVVAVRDLSEFRLSNPQAMLFAPSGDQTDDASQMSLYIADSGLAHGNTSLDSTTTGLQPIDGTLDTQSDGRIIEFSLIQPDAAGPVSFTSTLIHTVDLAAVLPPSTDPSGITYVSTTGTLLVSDCEVEETVNRITHFAGANVWELSLSGSVIRTANISLVSPTVVPMTNEPTGAAWNPANGHFYFTDDDSLKVFDLNPGNDHLVGTSDDSWTSFGTSTTGNGDPEGITFDNLNNRIFTIDGVNAEVYQYTTSGSSVSHFDVAVYGITDPEGIDFNAANGNLYVLGNSSNRLIVEVTTSGALVGTYSVSASNSIAQAGLAYAPASDGSGNKRFYIVDRGVDNNTDPNEVDGKMYEMSAPASAPVATNTPTVTGPLPPTSTPTITPTPTATLPGTGTLDIRVAASSDDAEEFASGSMYLGSSDLELVYDGSNQTVGMRFNGMTIPKGAFIINASIQFVACETWSEPTSLAIQGQAVDNAPTFANVLYNISSRPRTLAAMSWAPPTWPSGAAGPDQQTPDLAPVIQEIVNRSGWAPGNSLVIIITGTGHRTAAAYDRASGTLAPVLHVEYSSTPPGSPTATSTSTGTSTAISTATQTLTPSITPTPSDTSTPTATATQSLTPSITLTPTNSPTATETSTPTPTKTPRKQPTDTPTITPTDTGAPVSTDTPTPTPTATDTLVPTNTTTPTPGTALDIRVAAGSDDAEESAGGEVNLISTDLELVYDGGNQTVGLRFNGLTIPRGVSISNAYVQFWVDTTHAEATSLTIRGEASDNASMFTTTSGSLSYKTMTTASVGWSPVAWTNVGQAGPDQRTPNIASVVQEIVNRPGWSSGNSVVILINGAGVRTAVAYDGSPAFAPLLHLEWSTTPQNQIPVVMLGNPKNKSTFIQGYTVPFGGSANDFETGDLTPSMVWTSNLDGIIGTGGSFSRSDLRVGVHTITAQVTDSGGLVGSASLTLTVFANEPVLVGAGDISICDYPAGVGTSRLLDNIAGSVFTAGDNNQMNGTAAEFANCYDPTWGRHKARTHPVPGNHEYFMAGATPYYDYFGAAAGEPGKGYYSYDLGSWHILALNSEIDVTAGSIQEQWLRSDLAAHANICTLAYWHRPRFSSELLKGGDADMGALWQALYEYGADLVINGHDHFYERFALQNPQGIADPGRGIRQIIVGTGGSYLGYQFGTPVANSEVINNQTNGVLKLTLHATSYDWEFIPIAGQVFTDSGSGTCVDIAPANTPTPTPTGVAPSTATPTATPTSTAISTATATSTPTATDLSTATPTPTATRTATSTPTSTVTYTPTGTATSTVTSTPTATSAPLPDAIFADSFESGNTSAWSSSVTGGGDLSVSAAAALVGTNGLQAVINDNAAIYVVDESPAAEPVYRARFYFDPNSIVMAGNNAHFIFLGSSAAGTNIFKIELRFSTKGYQLRAGLLTDTLVETNTPWRAISDAPHTIELFWQASTAVGANNGSLSLWVDGVQTGNVTLVDNDTWRLERIWLGALTGIDLGTRGVYYFDDFVSRRYTRISP